MISGKLGPGVSAPVQSLFVKKKWSHHYRVVSHYLVVRVTKLCFPMQAFLSPSPTLRKDGLLNGLFSFIYPQKIKMEYKTM